MSKRNDFNRCLYVLYGIAVVEKWEFQMKQSRNSFFVRPNLNHFNLYSVHHPDISRLVRRKARKGADQRLIAGQPKVRLQVSHHRAADCPRSFAAYQMCECYPNA